ncbi:hypothetical protein [Rhodococcus pyridinivorans]|uniref:hypothetical protein n=1 Tax=Rhodococcus pyridinivorans TaxID=103816 RepID=UPI0026598C1D|nr:hypothetical protein [Rhodococcus pyridinivorans]
MSSPESIDLNYDNALAAAAELKDFAAKIDLVAEDFQKAVDAFDADARLEGDVLPASKATLTVLTQQTAIVRRLIGEITADVNRAADALNGRVAEAESSEMQSASVIDAIGAMNAGDVR